MSKKKKSNFAEQFTSSLKKAAKIEGVDPSELTVSAYRRALGDDAIKEWDLRKNGGFNPLKKLYFPQEEDIKEVYGIKLLNRKARGIDKKYGEKMFLAEAMSSVIQDTLSGAKFKVHRKSRKKVKKVKSSRYIVGVLSDTHYGKPVYRYEVPSNQYDWTVAARRSAMFFDQLVSYKTDHRDSTDCVLLLNGDIIEGLLHDLEAVDPLSIQFAGALHILMQGLTYTASNFNHVHVYCTTGNHGRNTSRHKQRATVGKFDSIETMLYGALKTALKDYDNISVHIPKTPWCDFKLFDHRYYLTHGDTVISSGNVGSSINIKSINNQINKLNANLKDDDEYKVVILGHVHTALSLSLDSGTELLVNGSLIGTDPYASSIGIFDSMPVQLMFEVTEEHAVGDLRKIKLATADQDASFDEIIEPYGGDF